MRVSPPRPSQPHRKKTRGSSLIEPRYSYTNNETRYSGSLYLQLFHSIRGQQGAGGGVAKSMPPLWCDALDLINEIDTAAEAWNPQPAGIPPTVGRLKALRARPWTPHDIARITAIREAITNWTTRITALLHPESVKYFSEPCPACGAKSVYRNDSGGDRLRQPALQIIADLGCTCLACRTHWGPELYLHLCRVLGFELPARVLE